MNNRKNNNLVKGYLESQPEATKQYLVALRDCILKVVPDATELFNYKIPAYLLVKGGNREQQIMIAGYNKHVGFYPHPTTMEKFHLELSEFKKGKGSVQFPLEKPLPKELIEKMVQYRVELLNK